MDYNEFKQRNESIFSNLSEDSRAIAYIITENNSEQYNFYYVEVVAASKFRPTGCDWVFDAPENFGTTKSPLLFLLEKSENSWEEAEEKIFSFVKQFWQEEKEKYRNIRCVLSGFLDGEFNRAFVR